MFVLYTKQATKKPPLEVAFVVDFVLLSALLECLKPLTLSIPQAL